MTQIGNWRKVSQGKILQNEETHQRRWRNKQEDSSASKTKNKVQYVATKQKTQKMKNIGKISSSSWSNLLAGINSSKTSFLMRQPTLDITSLK